MSSYPHFSVHGPDFWKQEEALVTTDTRAIGHILSHSYEYQRPERGRFLLSELLGNGELFFVNDQNLILSNINPKLTRSGILVTEGTIQF